MQTVIQGAIGAAAGAVVLVGAKMAITKFSPTTTDAMGNNIALAASLGVAALVAVKKPKYGAAAVGMAATALAVPAITFIGLHAGQLLAPAATATPAKAVSALFNSQQMTRALPQGRYVGAVFNAQSGQRVIRGFGQKLTPDEADAVLRANGYSKLIA